MTTPVDDIDDNSDGKATQLTTPTAWVFMWFAIRVVIYVVIWCHHLSCQLGWHLVVIWRHHLVLPSGAVIRIVIWYSHLVLPSGIVSWFVI
jgi:hypothetical protein